VIILTEKAILLCNYRYMLYTCLEICLMNDSQHIVK
jgi:hypothetical protein